MTMHNLEGPAENGKVSARSVISVKSNKTKADKKEKRNETSKMNREGSDGGRGMSNKMTSSRYHMKLHLSNSCQKEKKKRVLSRSY